MRFSWQSSMGRSGQSISPVSYVAYRKGWHKGDPLANMAAGMNSLLMLDIKGKSIHSRDTAECVPSAWCNTRYDQMYEDWLKRYGSN